MKFMLVLAVLGAVGWYYLKPLPPGKGPDAAKGMRISNALIQSIESYHAERRFYPATLEDMIPDFIAGVPRFSNGSSLEYKRLGQTFKLTFSYANPLPVHCSYEPGQKWACEWF
jgi:hypothetical protein